MDLYEKYLLLKKYVETVETQRDMALNTMSQIVEIGSSAIHNDREKVLSVLDVALDSQDKIMDMGKDNPIIFGLERDHDLSPEQVRVRKKLNARAYRKVR